MVAPVSAGDTVVVGLTNAANAGDIGFEKVVLCQIRDTLFGEDEVRLELDDLFAHGLDLLLFDLEDLVPVFLACDFDVGLRLSLLVFKGAVEEDDSWVLDTSSHLG